LKARNAEYVNYIFNPDKPAPMKYIHPLQVKKVQEFLKTKFSPDIRFILVFGSSIDLTCHSGSDLDLYIIHKDIDEAEREKLREEMYWYGRSLNIKCDFIFETYENYIAYAEEIGTVEYDVYREGVCIYAAGKDNAVGQGEMGPANSGGNA
jgi:predicted nucleotidyltransferase